MRIAVVDDERAFRQQIASMISSVYGREDVSCFLYADGAEVIKAFENGFHLDAVFLDIEMKELDGMSTAKLIRSYSKDIPIVFTTSHTEMAMEGYEVDAFRFLGKPIDEEKLRLTLNDLEKKLKVEEKIVLKKDGEELIFPISSLIYVEAANNSVRFVFTSSVVELRMKFSDAVKMVDGLTGGFFKIHRSYYINLGHVTKMSATEVLMDNGETLPVARGSASSAKKELFEYIRRNGR
ncbi:MAG: response regulator transcription factor [Clostridiales bacterium]|nr:response regulator transcription factor [Clostridiales bacterium]